MSPNHETPAPRKLPRTAYTLEEGEEFVPFTHGETLSEFTWKAARFKWSPFSLWSHNPSHRP